MYYIYIPIILPRCINNYRVDDERNKSYICLHVFLMNYSFGANMSRQPSSLQLPHWQLLQPRGVVCHSCPVHSNYRSCPVHSNYRSCPVHSNFSSLGDNISERQPISLTPQQRFELMFQGPTHYFIIPPQTDCDRMKDSDLEFYCSSITSHPNPNCSTRLSTPPPISPRPSLSSGNLRATANTTVIKNIETKPPYSFSALVAMAILSTPRRMATKSYIYNYISITFPFYDRSKRGWKNAVRNCLHTNKYFRKAPYAPKEE